MVDSFSREMWTARGFPNERPYCARYGILQGVEISVSSRVAGTARVCRSCINYLPRSVTGTLPQLDFTYAAYNDGNKLNAR